MSNPERQWVHVRVPATSANMGPGFDAIGVALDIWNDLEVRRADKFEIEITGEGEDCLPRDETNLIVAGLTAAFEDSGRSVPLLHYKCTNRIPFARGLGSSSAAIVSGLLAGLVLSGHELPNRGSESLLNIACKLEGHPDNVAPAIYGGVQVGVFGTLPERTVTNGAVESAARGDSPVIHGTVRVGKPIPRWISSRVPLAHGLQCVVLLPDTILETSKARGVLPDTVSRSDAIFNISRAGMLVNAFSTGRLDLLRVAMEDRLHQPQRASLNPHLVSTIDAALAAGALGACLSGAGPSVFAWTCGPQGDVFAQQQGERTERAVADAMLAAASKANVSARVFITRPTERGSHVVAADPPFSEARILHL